MLPIPKLPVQSEKAHYRLVMGFRNAECRSQSRWGTANLVFKEEVFMAKKEFLDFISAQHGKAFTYVKGAPVILGAPYI